MPRKSLDRASRRRGIHRSIYFTHRDMSMVDHLDQLVHEGHLPSLAAFVQRAVRQLYGKEFGEGKAA